MIRLSHVSKQYDQRPALADVTLEIGKGEFVLLMGPSGAGKSTLLRMLIGAERPDEGEIFVHQKNVTMLKRSEVPYLRRKVGTVFQDFRLLPKKSVFDMWRCPCWCKERLLPTFAGKLLRHYERSVSSTNGISFLRASRQGSSSGCASRARL
jgi:ABC-type ATPase involved in cell division